MYLLLPVYLGFVCYRELMQTFQIITELSFRFTRCGKRLTHHHQSLLAFSMSCLFRFSLLLLLLYSVLPSFAVKFNLQAYRWPQKKCFWNPAHDNTLVIVTANIGPGPNQRTDIEIIDSSPQQNVYLRKKGIKAETRLAITTHAEGEVGVCFYNYLEQGQCSILHHALRVMAF